MCSSDLEVDARLIRRPERKPSAGWNARQLDRRRRVEPSREDLIDTVHERGVRNAPPVGREPRRGGHELLGDNEASALLEKTLEEEKETDKKLTDLAEQINVEAKETPGEEEEKSSSRGRSRGARA